MATIKRSRRKSNHGVAILIILAISILLGFVIDYGITFLQKQYYPIKYSEFVEKYSKEYNVPEAIIYAVIKAESNFKSDAVSHSGAVGLMQLMPTTFQDITTNFLYENLDIGMRYDPETNIKYGVYYLSWIYTNFAHDWETAVAAYNAGVGIVFGRTDSETGEYVPGWLENPEYSDDGVTLKKIPFKETKNYVKKISRASEMYEELYSIN